MKSRQIDRPHVYANATNFALSINVWVYCELSWNQPTHSYSNTNSHGSLWSKTFIFRQPTFDDIRWASGRNGGDSITLLFCTFIATKGIFFAEMSHYIIHWNLVVHRNYIFTLLRTIKYRKTKDRVYSRSFEYAHNRLPWQPVIT